MFARSERKLTKGSLREGAVTSVRVTEGERVTIEQIQSTVGSFHHSVVPLPLGGRLLFLCFYNGSSRVAKRCLRNECRHSAAAERERDRAAARPNPYEYGGIKSLALNSAFCTLHSAFNLYSAQNDACKDEV